MTVQNTLTAGNTAGAGSEEINERNGQRRRP